MTSDLKSTVVITGLGRSGTTWLSQIVNYRQEFRYIFEPLHPTKGIALRDLLLDGQYVHPSFQDDGLKTAYQAMFAGDFENAFADQFRGPQDNNHRLVKLIRLSFALKWVRDQFPELRIVYITRHPGAVVTSQMRQQWGDGAAILNRLQDQDALMEDHLAPFVEDLRAPSNEFERRVVIWCAAHYVLLRQFRPGEMYWVLYEALVSDPLNESRRMLDYLGIEFDAAKVQKAVQRPSPTTWNAKRSNPSTAWKRELSRSQIAFIQDKLKRFGLDGLYSKDGMPDQQALEQLLAAEDLPRPNRTQRKRFWTRFGI